MDSDAAGAEFIAVQNEIVAFGAHFPRRGFEFFQVFVNDARERMLRAHPCLVGFAPLEKGKTGEPQEFPLRFVDHAERFAEMQAQLAGDQRGGFGAFDLFFRGNGDHKIAGLRATSLGELFYILYAD